MLGEWSSPEKGRRLETDNVIEISRPYVLQSRFSVSVASLSL